MNIVYFGSFQHYSALILEALLNTSALEVVAVVTTPPAPVGRKKILTKNPTHTLAETSDIPVYTPESLGRDVLINDKLKIENSVDYFLTAGYGNILPREWLDYPTNGSLNLHFSLLPKYRGANPAEWAILLNEKETGISLIQMDEGLDTGKIIEQAPLQIDECETRETLYEKLYGLGALKLPQWLLNIENVKLKMILQPSSSPTPPARRFTRQEGFIDWEIIKASIVGKPINPALLPPLLKAAFKYRSLPITHNPQPATNAFFIDRAIRALAGFPGVWTKVNTAKGPKRLKILSSHIVKAHTSASLHLDTVQLEGQQPTQYNQIKNQII